MGTLEDTSSRVSRSFETDTEGNYIFRSLPFGRYRLSVTRSGFAAQTLLIEIQSSTPAGRTVVMALAP